VIYQDSLTGEVRHGVASNYVCDLKVGDQVKLTGPAGNRFLLPEQFLDCHYVFIATGTGIAPFRGMLYQLFHHQFRGEAWLIFGVQYRGDILYEKEFRQHETQANFHFVTAISREETNSDGSKVYVQHRLLEYQNQLVPLMKQSNTQIYICGIAGMEKGIDQVFRTIFSTEIYGQVKKRVLVEVY
jgi:ferredoxin--NADP+ reductase